jgi:ATP-dependent Clp protease ATP-binding subunit ClpA
MRTTAQIKLHRFYTSALGRALRLLTVFLLLTWVYELTRHQARPNLFLFILNMSFMIEIFFHYKIGRIFPTSSLAAHPIHLIDACSRDALFLIFNREIEAILPMLLKEDQVQFLLKKAAIDKRDITPGLVQKETLLKEAATIASQVHGTYITTMDIIVAYLILSESKTQLLFKKELKPDDLMHILSWARSTYREEESPRKFRIVFNGEGLGETIVSGWTPETKNYTRDFTTKAWSHRPLLVGREQDFERLVETLSKPENNNVLLVGESGVGKETLVEAFAYDSSDGSIGGGLDRKQILEIMVGQLIAGAANRADLEVRLQAIVEEVAHALNVILYIPEFQNMVGGGSYDINIAGALLPYLQDGHLPIIATLTPGNYKKYVENTTLTDVFSTIEILEPDEITALHMLFEKAANIESATHATVSYKAVQTAVAYARKYLPDSQLPGSAVQLLTDTAHRIASTRSENTTVHETDILQEVEVKTHMAVGIPGSEEKKLLLNLESFLHERIIGQHSAIRSISEALRRLRSGVVKATKPTSFLFLGPTGVGKTETAKALAQAYYGGEDHILRFDMSEYVGAQGMMRLLGSPPGAGDARGELTEKVHDNPSALILLDEFEKADPQILNLFLQVFEDGRLTDNKGKTVSFIDTIIIATSNAGSEFIREQITKGSTVDDVFEQSLLEYLQTNSVFKPELLNRFDDVVIFTPLTDEELVFVVGLLITSLVRELEKQEIHLVIDEKVIEKIVTEGKDAEFGARPLRRYLQDTLEDRIAKMRLQDLLTRGSTVTFSVDELGEFTQTIVPYSLDSHS